MWVIDDMKVPVCPLSLGRYSWLMGELEFVYLPIKILQGIWGEKVHSSKENEGDGPQHSHMGWGTKDGIRRRLTARIEWPLSARLTDNIYGHTYICGYLKFPIL